MSEPNDSTESLQENPLLRRLIGRGAANSMIYWGYFGPPSTEDRITFYPSLNDLSVSLDIARDDIIDIADVPETLLPFGAKVIWVKINARIGRRFARIGPVHPGTTADFVEVTKGRLNMRVRTAPFRGGGGVDSDCVSPCSTCRTECSVCKSVCTLTG